MFFAHLFSCIVPTGVNATENISEVSAGSVNNCSKPLISAVNKLSDRYIEWPSESRRVELSCFAWEKFGFRGCIGSVDGSQVPLAYAPRVQTWKFWDIHDRYSIHTLVASDHERNIISVTLEFSGSASDALVQQQADWARFLGEHFPLGGLLPGEKGMHFIDRVVGPHIGRSGFSTSNETFDWQLARLRAISEHTFGIANGPWASLKKQRLSIGSEEDFLAVMEWILACCVLHNICITGSDGEVDPSPTLAAVQGPLPSHPAAEATRSRVKRDGTAFMKATGVYIY